MQAASTTHILVVANRTAATPALLAAVRERMARGPCRFTLLVPRSYWEKDTEESAITLELAVPLMEEVAGGHVEAEIGDTDPFVAVRSAHEREPFDEIVISTLPTHVSRWLRLDLPARVRRLGVPVTVVTAKPASRELGARS